MAFGMDIPKMVEEQFVTGIEEMERTTGFRRDLIIEGLERALKRLKEQEPTKQ